MGHPLDPLILSIAASQHIELIRLLIQFAFIVSVVGFLFFWFAALWIWIRGMIDAWKNKRGLFWGNNLQNPFVQRFLATLLKGFLVWLLAGWPLILILTGLASTEAFNTLLGYEAISGPE